jgi:hypothetical protein
MITVALASLGFSSCNSALFAIFFFSNQGFALDATSISDDGYFLLLPTIAFYASSFSFVFSVFAALAFILFFFASLIKLQTKSFLAITLTPTVLSTILLYLSSSIFILDPDFIIRDGIAAGSVSPVLTYRFATMICLTLLALTIFVIALGRIISRTTNKVKS